jgi:hypothetical protein
MDSRRRRPQASATGAAQASLPAAPQVSPAGATVQRLPPALSRLRWR